MYYPTEIQAVVFEATGLAAGSHTLAIEVTGTRHAASTGSAIAVDAFDVRPRFEDIDGSIAYTGAWLEENMDRAWSGTSANTGSATASLSATAGARAEFAFTGTSVSWIGFRGPLSGIANVYLDGAFVTELDMYAPAEELRVPVFTASDLTSGPHTLRIDVTGLKNEAATSAYVVVDAFDVTVPSPAPAVTRTQESHASVAYTNTGDWTQNSPGDVFTGRTAALSRAPGARATFTFNGTAVRWIGQRGFSTGIARVFLDGVMVAEIDTFTPVQVEYQAPVFTATGLAAGSHTLEIEVTGLKNAGSGDPVVIVDAFDVY
jgi:hypothetical protein